MKEFFYDKTGIYYRTNTFERSRETLVFIHGLSASSVYWTEYEKIFEDKYNILFLDLRGHGKSLKYQRYSDYGVEKFAEDIFDLIEHLDIDKFVLISHSFGTIVALEFLALHQDRISGLVLLSPSMSVAKKIFSRFFGWVLGMTKIFGLFQLKRKTAGHVDYIKYKGTGDWGITRIWADIKETSLRAYLFSLRNVYSFNRDELLEKINVPTLIIHGNKDTYFPIKNSYVINSRIKNSEFVIIDGADHIIVLNNVKEVSAAIIRFVEQVKNISGEKPGFNASYKP